MNRYGRLPEGYAICPSCSRLTPTYMGYCVHCGAPIHYQLPQYESYHVDICLGLDNKARCLGISRRDLTRSLIIYGSLGSGKTTAVARLLHESRPYGISFLLLDYEGEYVDKAEDLEAMVLTPGEAENSLHVPLLRPPHGIPWKSHAEWTYKLLTLVIKEEEWNITPQMEAVLKHAVYMAVGDRARLQSLPYYIDKAASGLPAGHQTAAALKARLTRIYDGPLAEVFEGPNTLSNPLYGRRIINLQPLAKLSSLEARITSLVILNRVRQAVIQAPPRRGPVGTLIVIEEAEELIPPGSPSLNQVISIISHGRKKGVGTIIVSHSPLLISQDLVNLVGNHMVFRLDSYRSALSAANLLGEAALVDEIRRLRTGEAFLRTVSVSHPIRISIDPMVSGDDIMKLLDSVIKYPYFTTRERRSYLGWDGEKYRRVVEEAKRRGYIVEKYFYKGTGRPIKLLETRGMNPSAPHKYAEYHVDLLLQDKFGIKPNKGVLYGPDFSFKINGKRIALEIETGSNLDAGKLLGRLRNYDYLIILCTSKECLRTARRIALRTKKKDRIFITSFIGLEYRIRRIIKLINNTI